MVVGILEGRNAGRHNHKPCLHGRHPLPPPEPINSTRAAYHVPGPGTHDPNPRVLSTSRVYLAQGSEAHVPADLRSAKMGLPSEDLAFEDTFFSPLYVHSMFGPLSPWAVRTRHPHSCVRDTWHAIVFARSHSRTLIACFIPPSLLHPCVPPSYADHSEPAAADQLDAVIGHPTRGPAGHAHLMGPAQLWPRSTARVRARNPLADALARCL